MFDIHADAHGRTHTNTRVCGWESIEKNYLRWRDLSVLVTQRTHARTASTHARTHALLSSDLEKRQTRTTTEKAPESALSRPTLSRHCLRQTSSAIWRRRCLHLMSLVGRDNGKLVLQTVTSAGRWQRWCWCWCVVSYRLATVRTATTPACVWQRA